MSPRPAPSPWRALLGALAVLAGVVACSGIITGPDGGPDTRPRSIMVAPSQMVLVPNDTARLTPSLFDVTGAATTVEPGQAIRYVSLDPSIAMVDSTGLVTGIADGATTVRAEYGALGLGIPVRVLARPRLVVVSGDAQSGEQGDTLPLPLVVRALDPAGQPVANVAVSFSASIGGGSITAADATTDGSGLADARWVLGLPLGPQLVAVHAAGYDSVTFLATATAGTRVVRVDLLPSDSILVGAGDTATIGRRAYNVADVELAGATFAWSSSALAVAAVSPSGQVTSVAPGTAYIKATSGTGADSVLFTVLAPPAIAVAPEALSFVTNEGTSPAPQAFDITNAGGDRLTGLSVSIAYGAGASGWLSVALDSTVAPLTVPVTPATDALVAGDYTATITIASSRPNVTSRAVTVQLSVQGSVPLPKLDLGPDIDHPAQLQARRSLTIPANASGPVLVTLRTTDVNGILLSSGASVLGGEETQVEIEGGTNEAQYWMQGLVGGSERTVNVVAEAVGYAPDTLVILTRRPMYRLRRFETESVPATGGADPVFVLELGDVSLLTGEWVPMAVSVGVTPPVFTLQAEQPTVGLVQHFATPVTSGGDQGPAVTVTFAVQPEYNSTSSGQFVGTPASLRLARTGVAGSASVHVTAAPPEWDPAVATLGFTLTGPEVPIILVAPDAPMLASTAGSVVPATTVSAITNEGVGTLDGLAVDVLYGAGASDWLLVTLDGTTAPTTLRFAASAEFLEAGTYTATVTVSSTVPGVAPVDVAVVLTVSPVVASGVLHWSGAVSDAWAVAANWVEGIAPTEGDSVVIPAAGVVRMPRIPASASVRSLVSLNAGSITVEGDALMRVSDALVLRTDVLAATCISGAGIRLTMPSTDGFHPVSGRMDCGLLAEDGDRILVDSLVLESQSLVLTGTVRFRTAGHPVHLDDEQLFVEGGARLEMLQSGDRVYALFANLYAAGQGDMFSAGELHLRQGLAVVPGGGDFVANPDHRVVLTASAPGDTATLLVTTGVRLGSLDARLPTRIDGTLELDGSVALGPQGALIGTLAPSFGLPERLRVAGDLIVAGGATTSVRLVELGGALTATTFAPETLAFIGIGQRVPFDGSVSGLRNVRVSGTATAAVVANQRRAIAGDLVIDGDFGIAESFNAAIQVNGSLRVIGNGLLRLGGAYSSIRVEGNALFDGRATAGELASGDLELRGDLVQRATTSPRSFRPAAGFNVTFIGSGAIDFATPDLSFLGTVDHFGNLTRTLRSDVTAQGLVRYDLNGVTVRSDVLGVGGARTFTTHGLDLGGSVTARNVTFRVLDGGPLTLDGGTTFADFDPAVVQLDLVRSSGVVALDFATFTTVPSGTGRYLRAMDTTGVGDGAFTVNVTNVTPAAHGGFAEAAGGAVINGWPAGVALPKLALGDDILHPAGLQVLRHVRFPASIASDVAVTLRSLDSTIVRVALDDESVGRDSLQLSGFAGDTAVRWVLQGMEGATGSARIVASAPGFESDTIAITMIRPALVLELVTPAQVAAGDTAMPILRLQVGYNDEGTLIPMGLRAHGPGAVFTITSDNPAVSLLHFTETAQTTGAAQAGVPSVTFTLRPRWSATQVPDSVAPLTPTLLAEPTGLAGLATFTPSADPEWVQLGASPALEVIGRRVVLTPDSIGFAATIGDTAPLTADILVTNASVGRIGGLAAEVLYGAGASDWLAVTFDSITTPTAMHVAAMPEFLAAGTWTAKVIVTSIAPGAASDTLEVSITVAGADRIIIVSGDGQQVPWGEYAPDSLKVRVLRADGSPLGDSFVQFSVSANGGSVSPTSEVTDENGYVATRWLMSDALGTHTVTVSRAGYQSAVFTGTSVAGTYVTRVAITAGRTSFTSVGDSERFSASAFNLADSLITSTALLWESTDLAVATVDDSGTVTVVGGGTTYIRASVDDGIDSVLVTVTLPLPVGLSIVSGDAQSATVGTALAAPVVIRYIGIGGAPVSGASLRVQGVHGCCNPFLDSTVTTDAAGLASIRPTMPTVASPATFTVSVVGAPTVTNATFTATPLPGAAVALQFSLNTGGGNAGSIIAPGWVVRAMDAFSNTATAFTGPITVALSNGPTGITTLGGTTTRNAVAGVATFNDLTVNVAATSWVLLASSPGLTGAGSAAFSISIPVSMTIVGNPVLGVGSSATVRLAIPVPSYGTGLVLGLVALNPSIITVNAPASVTLPVGDTVAFFTITGAANGASFLNATLNGVGAGQILVNVTNQIISLPSTLNVPFGLTTSLPVQLAVPAPAGGLTVAVASSDPSRVAVTTPTVFFAAGTTLASATLSGVLPGPATISATAPGWVTDTTHATTTLELDLIQTNVSIDASFGSTATVAIRSGGSLIAAPAGGVPITLTARNTACVAVPATVTVAAGSTQIAFPVTYGGTAATPCASYVVASAPNAVIDSMLVNVAVPPFVTAYDASLGAGMQISTSTNVSSTTFGTTTLHIESLDPSLVVVAPNASTVGTTAIDATIIQPTTSYSYYIAALENVTGTARVVVAAPGFRPDTAFIAVRPLGIEFISAPSSISSFASNFDLQVRIGGLSVAGNTIGFEYPLRAGGTPIVVTLANGNAAVAQLISSAGTGQSRTTTIPVGSSRIPVSLGAGGVLFDPLAAGTTTLTATSPGITPMTGATWPVTVTSPFTSVGNVTLGAGTHLSTSFSLSAPQHGGVTVRVASSDSTRVLVAPNATTPATPFIDVVVPNGSTTAGYYVAALEGITGTATIDVSAPGFASAQATATVRALGIEWISTPGTTTSLSNNSNLQLRFGGLNAAGTIIETEYPIRFGGVPITATLTNSNAAAAQLVSAALTGQVVTTVIPVGSSRAPVGVASGGVDFDPLGAGVTQLTVTSPGILSVPNATANVTVNAPAISPGGGTLGAGTQLSTGATFGASQHGGVTVHIESSDPTRVLLAPNATAPAVAALDLVMPNGSASVSYHIAALENVTGTATITVSAPGFTTANATVTVRPLGVEIFQSPTTTTSLSPSTLVRARVGGLNAAGTSIETEYPIRTGGVPITVTITNANGTVGQLVTSTATGQSVTAVIPVGDSRMPTSVATGGVEFDPLSSGSTTLTVTGAGLTTVGTVNWPITVSTPTISTGSSALGSGTQLQTGVSLGATAYGAVTVHIESSDPSLVVVAPNASTVGTAAIDVALTAPSTSVPFVIAALEGVTGTATLTISAPGFTSATYAVTVRGLGVEVFSLTPSIGAASAGTDFLARLGGLNAAGNAIETEYPLRVGGTPIVVTFDNSNAAVAQLSTSAGTAQSRTVTVGLGQSRSPNGVPSGGIRFLPLAAGSTVVTASAPGVVRTLNGTQTVTVTP